MGRIIGIDLGTCNSLVSGIENDKPIVVPTKGEKNLIPSMVAFNPGGGIIVGTDAKRKFSTNVENTVYEAKRFIGRSYDSEEVQRIKRTVTYDLVRGENGEVLVALGDLTVSLEQVSAYILEECVRAAEAYFGDKVDRAVVTVPAYYNDKQRAAVKAAGELIELEIIRIINEPTAAALAFGLGRGLQKRVFVYDLGGGTFDATIVHIRDQTFEVLATGGDTLLGGVDVDNRIVEYLRNSVRDQFKVDLIGDFTAHQRLKEAAEQAKIELSFAQDTLIHIPYLAQGPDGPVTFEEILMRVRLEEWAGEVIERTFSTCEEVMRDAECTVDQIDDILLVGGMTRMPLVQERLTQYFGKPPSKQVQPDHAVAIGAALMAWSLTERTDVSAQLLDVLPMAIGFAAGGGKFVRVFERNSPVPNYAKRVFRNVQAQQTSMSIAVGQGDSDVARENEYLGRFEVMGLPAAEPGTQKIEVIFEVSQEGLLKITSEIPDTGEKIQTEFVVATTSTSDEEPNAEVVAD